MKKNILLAILVVLLQLAVGVMAEAQQRINSTEAAKYVGKKATVCGLVTGVNYAASNTGSPTFLNLDHGYPDQKFTAVIWGTDRPKFPKPPEMRYAGEKICVTGTIIMFRKVAEIVVTEPSQITRDE
jgi:hypothetical protein